jgi:hypothetical protein
MECCRAYADCGLKYSPVKMKFAQQQTLLANTATNVPRLGNFFATSPARLDRWRKLNAKRKPDPLGAFRSRQLLSWD